MPKPNRFVKSNWKNNERNNFQETHVVTFKPNRRDKRRPVKDWGRALREQLLEDDVDMGGTSGPARVFDKNKMGRKGNRSGSPAILQKRKLLESPSGWYRVTLPYGNKYDKSYILRTLLENLTPLTLCPVTWKTNGTVATFYVDDYKTAEKLHSLDRQIKCPDGFRMIIRINTGSPHVELSTDMKEKMKLTMAKRYNSATKALDLTKFHADPDLQDYFCGLCKPIVFYAVVEIISENIPELEALNLHENKIQIIIQIKRLNEKLPNLKILHMGNNKIKDISMLDPFSGLNIVDLVLDGNPLCDKFTDQATYISEVRKRFPKVVKLDGVDLPPPISFDIQEEVSMPTPQQTFLCNQEGQDLVRKFLEQYFTIFDGESRQPLLQAYHENAMFSLTSAYPYGQNQKSASWLNWYNADNRNLLRVHDGERRHKLLKQGHLAVVSFLQEMPETKHDIHSFTVDLMVYTPRMIVLTVAGMFRELKSGHKTPPLRYFFRTLVIVPAGAGFCVINETLHVTNATDQQAKTAFKIPQPEVAAPAPVPASPVVPSAPDDNTKMQMVQTMAQMSGMNLAWSQKCLEETQWDYQRACDIFNELHKQGVIPAEAFVK